MLIFTMTDIDNLNSYESYENKLARSVPIMACLQWGHTKVATINQSFRPTHRVIVA